MSMKLFTCSCLLASLLFTACQQQETGGQLPVADEISFETEVVTRGTPILQNTIQNFGVYGYYTGTDRWADVGNITIPNKMYNVKVSRKVDTSDTWEYDTKAKWTDLADNPVGLGYFFHFFGYAPYILNGAVYNSGVTLKTTATSKGVPTLNYMQPDGATNQIDLLVASPIIDRMNIGRKVVMKFKHSLSKIGFSASIADAVVGRTYKITKLSMNFRTAGGNIFRQADLDLSTTLWSNLSVPYDDGYLMTIPLSAIALTAAYQTISSSTDLPFFLPQEVSDGAVTLSVTVQKLNGDIVEATQRVNDIPFPATLWEAGKAYNYRYSVSFDTKNVALRDVVVTDWTVSSGGSFDIQ